MHGFSHRHTVQAALAWLDAQLHVLGGESVPLRLAAGRILAEPIDSTVDVPGFNRATMDGYAVVADSTEGASPYNRMPLRVLGDAMPGAPFAAQIGTGEAVRIMTGAPIPVGADAVVPAEFVEVGDGPAEGGSHAHDEGSSAEAEHFVVSAVASVSPGKNIGLRAEDIAAGSTLLTAGRQLRPQDLGVISSIGIASVRVVRRPRVRLVITGNELLPSGSPPHDFLITDANGPMLAALIERDGGLVDCPGIVPDDADAILAAFGAPQGEPSKNDLVIVSGGSSVGVEDLAPMLVAAHGELPIHGIAMRPSSPTGIGRIGDRLVFLLPGNPVSALCAYDFFAGRAIRALGGRPKEWPYAAATGTLDRKISSQIGRLDYARVRMLDGRVSPLAIGGASVLSSATRADGFVVVPADSEGFAAGATVTVWLYA